MRHQGHYLPGEKADTRHRHLAWGCDGELGTEASPYQEIPEIPWLDQAEHKRETHWGEEMFSHKSNFLQFVFQQQICFQFQMPLFKNDLLPFDYNRTPLILQWFACKYLSIQLGPSPSFPELSMRRAPQLCQRFSRPCSRVPALPHLAQGAINIYYWIRQVQP